MATFTHVQNAETLLSRGEVELRRDALRILDDALAAVDPYHACRRQLRCAGGELIAGDRAFPVGEPSRIWFFGAGKASFRIAQAVEDELGDRLEGGLVVCKEGHAGSLARIDVLHASHPIPSAASVAAARRMIERAGRTRAGDIVICGITGGSSALLTLPWDGLALSDLQSATEILLTCGADIFEINAVRKHLSRVGGGRLAATFDPGVRLINLTVSDVIGDALDYITDPTVPDTSTVDDARATLERFRLWERMPQPISRFLGPGGGVTETPKELPLPVRHDVVLLSAASPCEAARIGAEALGYAPLLLSTSFDGESQSLGRSFGAIARDIARRGVPMRPPCAVLGGGETIVRMSAFGGLGGPNQEFALAGALLLPRNGRAALLGIDTDGSDGPTQIAGALCDSTTAARADGRGIDLRRALEDHNVTPALLDLGDAVATGPTGTNVNDLKLLLVR